MDGGVRGAVSVRARGFVSVLRLCVLWVFVHLACLFPPIVAASVVLVSLRTAQRSRQASPAAAAPVVRA